MVRWRFRCATATICRLPGSLRACRGIRGFTRAMRCDLGNTSPLPGISARLRRIPDCETVSTCECMFTRIKGGNYGLRRLHLPFLRSMPGRRYRDKVRARANPDSERRPLHASLARPRTSAIRRRLRTTRLLRVSAGGRRGRPGSGLIYSTTPHVLIRFWKSMDGVATSNSGGYQWTSDSRWLSLADHPACAGRPPRERRAAPRPLRRRQCQTKCSRRLSPW